MKIILFSGFLGAGKTMAILSLAKYLTTKANEGAGPAGTKLAIIENEVGETGIDDRLLGGEGYRVASLLSGCICCTLATSLTQTLNDLHGEYDPEYVVFEPTGVAFPDRISETLRAWGKGVEWIRQVTLVDAKRWDKIRTMTPTLAEAQVAGADLILLNKCDLVDEKKLDALEADLRGLNAKAPIHRVVATRAIEDSVWEEAANG